MNNPPRYDQQIAIAGGSLITALFRISNSTLSGSMEWLVGSILFFIFAVGATVAFLVETTRSTVGYLSVNYIILVFSVLWLSIISRDARKAKIYVLYGAAHQELHLPPLSESSLRLRVVAAWIFFSIAIIIFIIGMILVTDNIIDAVLAEIILMISTLVLVKTVQDRADAKLWASML